MLALGTYRISGETAVEMVQSAYNAGLRCFDTAQLYKNDKEVTDWLESKTSNDTTNNGCVFLTTKIHRTLIKNSDKDNRAVVNSVYGRPSLVLLHSPEKNYEIAWKQLTESTLGCKFGVSNFTPEQIERLDVIPYANQIELSPYCQSRCTVQYCESKGIIVQGHSTLAKGELLDESVLYNIAKKYEATVAQIMLAWGLRKNYTMCFTTSDKDHLKEDLASVVISKKIMEDDMAVLDSLDCGYRTHPQFKVE